MCVVLFNVTFIAPLVTGVTCVCVYNKMGKLGESVKVYIYKHVNNICRANDKSASIPVSYGRRVTSRTEITCLEDAIKLQRTHTEYRSPIRVNDIG